ncbi:MAG: transcriptional repressor [Clostridiaceae bacterium]|nr:transcriptional repressor [Clostridiaceae bacterium]
MTKQRSLILQVLRDSHKHLTAAEICELARQTIPTLAVGTVYRNLNLLADQGQVLRVRTAGSSDRFDAAPAPHEHLICTRCGKLTDVDLPDLRQLLTRRAGTQIIDYRLELYHVCPACVEKERRT